MSPPEPLRLSLLHFRLKETTDEFIAAANGDGRVVQQESHQLQCEEEKIEHETAMDQMDDNAAAAAAAPSQPNGVAEPAQAEQQTITVADSSSEKTRQGEEGSDMNVDRAVAQDEADAASSTAAPAAGAVAQSGEEAAPVPSPSAAEAEEAASSGTNVAAEAQQQQQQQTADTDTMQETPQDNVVPAASTQNSQGSGADGADAQSALDKLLGSLENSGSEQGPASTDVSQVNEGERDPPVDPVLNGNGEVAINTNAPDSAAMDTQPSESLAPLSETSNSQPGPAQETVKEEQPAHPAAVDYQSPLPSHLQSQSNSPYPTNSGQAQTSPAAPAVMSSIKGNYDSPRSTGPAQPAAATYDRKPEALSRLAKLRQRVAKDKFDGEAWLQLIADASEKGDLERTREAYSGFLKNFPDNVRFSSLSLLFLAVSAMLRKSETKTMHARAMLHRADETRQSPCLLVPVTCSAPGWTTMAEFAKQQHAQLRD